jgi:hypothetical protein
VKGFRTRLGLRVLAVLIGVGTAVLGLGAVPASALNHDSYNILKNTGSHQYCLDIRTEDPLVGARAHLWTCTRPVVAEQQFLLVTGQFGDQIKVQRSGFCLEPGPGGVVIQMSCISGARRQNWVLKDTGEIVNTLHELCLDADPADTKNAEVVVAACNGSISQRWFF